MGGAPQQPGERFLLAEQRHPVGQAVLIRALEAAELEGQHGQRPAHRVQIGAGRRAVGLDLRSLVADRPVDRLVAVDPADASHVDELELFFGLDDVVRLEVAVHHPAVVQVAEGGQHLDSVGQGMGHRHRASRLARVDQDLLERLAAHILHHDVAGHLSGAPVRVLDEVVDPDDIGVLDLGQELPLGDGGRHGVGVAGVQQALQHHPPVADVVVLGQVDPAEAAVGEAAEHLILADDQFSRLQLGAERELGAAIAAESFGQAGTPVPAPAHGLIAAAAVALGLWHLRVGQHGAGRIPVRNRRDVDQARAEPAPGRPAAAAAPGPGARAPGPARGP